MGLDPKNKFFFFPKVLIIVLVLQNINFGSCSQVPEENWYGFLKACDSEDPQNFSLSCHGLRIIRNLLQQLLLQAEENRNFTIVNGISLVDVGNLQESRGFWNSGSVKNVLGFLKRREIRIMLPSLLPGNFEEVFKQTLQDVSEGRGKGGGGKKGGGGMMAVMMMCKMMAAMGFGALGLLAMKALMVSSLALMLSLIVAVKKLGGGGREDHSHIVYSQEGHHHSKRSSENYDFSPFRGYARIYSGENKQN